MNIDQYRNMLQMNRSAFSFSNLSCGVMAGSAPAAIVQNATIYLEKSERNGLYECAQCKKKFKTPMDSTKMPLWKWLLGMDHSSKGVSSVFLGKLVGIFKKLATKIGHAVRKMMDTGTELVSALQGTLTGLKICRWKTALRGRYTAQTRPGDK